MAETIRGINVVIGAETTGLGKALDDVDRKSRSIQTELKQVERLLRLDPTNTELVAQKQKLLAEAVSTTQSRLKTLRDAQEQVNEQFAKGEISEQRYRDFQRELVKTEQELRRVEAAAKGVAINIDQLAQGMTKAGGALTKAVTAPITALAASSLKASIDFESAFAGVRKTVDATEQQFATLEQGIRNMAKEIPTAATEIAGIAEAAGQLGIRTESILGFTRVMADLGVTTNLTATDAATNLARLANITQMSQDEFDRLGSTIVALGNNLATTEAEIVEMGLRIAGAGAQVGMTEDQILSYAAALSSVGIEAQAGGSAISKVMIEIASQVSSSGEKLDLFAAIAGQTADEFSKAWKDDAAAALTAFIEGLGRMSETGMDVFGVLDELGLSEVRVRDAMLRAAGAGDLLRQSLELGSKAWEENSALTKEAEQRYGTTESQMAMLWNRVKDVGITLGGALTPALHDVLDVLKPVIGAVENAAKWFADLDPRLQKVIIGTGMFAATLGPALLLTGSFARSILEIKSFIGLLSPAIATLSAGFGLQAAAAGTAATATAAAGTAAATATPAVYGLAGAVNALLGPWGLLAAGIAGFIALVGSIPAEMDDTKLRMQQMQTEAWVLAGTLDGDLSPAIGHVTDKLNEQTEALAKNAVAMTLSPAAEAAYRNKQKRLWDEMEKSAVRANEPASEFEDIMRRIIELMQTSTPNIGKTADAFKDVADSVRQATTETKKYIDTLTPWIDEKRAATDEEIRRWAAGSYIQQNLDKPVDPNVIRSILGVTMSATSQPSTSTRPEQIVSSPVNVTENVYIYGNADRRQVEQALEKANDSLVQRLRLAMPGVIP